jgi:hypothetical protein
MARGRAFVSEIYYPNSTPLALDRRLQHIAADLEPLARMTAVKSTLPRTVFIDAHHFDVDVTV